MKKQSSIEWLEEQVVSKDWLSDKGKAIFQQAKEMHKQEIIEATKYGNSFEQGDLICETYYKKTYEKDN